MLENKALYRSTFPVYVCIHCILLIVSKNTFPFLVLCYLSNVARIWRGKARVHNSILVSQKTLLQFTIHSWEMVATVER